jgi:hypothetical protein
MPPPILDAWTIPERAFPRDATPAVQWQFLLHYAVLAPSIYNTQPWRFHVQAEALDLYLDAARALPIADPHQRQAVISCGAVLANLHVALRHFGYAGMVETLPDATQPDLLARLHLGPLRPATELDHLLFQSIPQRHTDRQPFTDQALPTTLFPTVQAVAAREEAWLQPVSGAKARAVLGTLVAVAERQLWASPAYRAERGHWEHPPTRPHPDGIPGAALGHGPLYATFGPFVTPWVDLGGVEGAHNRTLIEAAPLVLVLGTTSDTRAAWLAAGRALEQVLLRAAAAGVSASFFHAPLEVRELRPLVSELVGRTDWAQGVLRLGYGGESAPTPRRDACTLLD